MIGWIVPLRISNMRYGCSSSKVSKAIFDHAILAVEAFNTLLEAQVLVQDWRIEYNTVRPHSALGYLTPTDYAKAWTANHPALS